MYSELLNVKIQPFDYQYLIGLLKGYSYPRNKISKMLRTGDIIALKRGFYILSDKYNLSLTKEIIANLLYGPSYISLEYALSYYGLIPEYVFNVTSVTSTRKKVFETAAGTYTYQRLKLEYYSIGYIVQRTDDIQFLIASQEKAICDKLYLSPRIEDVNALSEFLYSDLRIELEYLKDIDRNSVTKLALAANNHNVNLFKSLLSNHA